MRSTSKITLGNPRFSLANLTIGLLLLSIFLFALFWLYFYTQEQQRRSLLATDEQYGVLFAQEIDRDVEDVLRRFRQLPVDSAPVSITPDQFTQIADQLLTEYAWIHMVALLDGQASLRLWQTTSQTLTPRQVVAQNQSRLLVMMESGQPYALGLLDGQSHVLLGVVISLANVRGAEADPSASGVLLVGGTATTLLHRALAHEQATFLSQPLSEQDMQLLAVGASGQLLAFADEVDGYRSTDLAEVVVPGWQTQTPGTAPPSPGSRLVPDVTLENLNRSGGEVQQVTISRLSVPGMVSGGELALVRALPQPMLLALPPLPPLLHLISAILFVGLGGFLIALCVTWYREWRRESVLPGAPLLTPALGRLTDPTRQIPVPKTAPLSEPVRGNLPQREDPEPAPISPVEFAAPELSTHTIRNLPSVPAAWTMPQTPEFSPPPQANPLSRGDDSGKTASYLRMLYEVNQQYTNLLPIREIARVAADAIQQLPEVEYVAVLTGEDELGPFRYVAAHNLPGDTGALNQDQALPLWGVLAQALVSRQTDPERDYFIIRDTVREQRPKPEEFLWSVGPGSLLIVPMRRGDKAIGVIVAGSSQPNSLNNDSLAQYVRAIASNTARSIHEAQIREQSTRWIRQLVGLQALTHTFNRPQTLGEMLNTLNAELTELFSLAEVRIFLDPLTFRTQDLPLTPEYLGVSPGERCLALYVGGERETDPGLLSNPRLLRLTQWSMAADQPLFFDLSDLSREEGENTAWDLDLDELYYRSTGRALVVPIGQEQGAGAILIISDEAMPTLEESDLIVMRTIANSVSILLGTITVSRRIWRSDHFALLNWGD